MIRCSVHVVADKLEKNLEEEVEVDVEIPVEKPTAILTNVTWTVPPLPAVGAPPEGVHGRPTYTCTFRADSHH